RAVGPRARHAGPRREIIPWPMALDAAPKLAQRVQPLGWFIAGDQTRVDCSDRSSDNPVRLDPRLVQRLIDAGLIGAERTAALQHENDLAVCLIAKRRKGFGSLMPLGNETLRIVHRT